MLGLFGRYDELWMPLISDLTEGSTPPMILPPLDVEWVWFCHTLNPVRNSLIAFFVCFFFFVFWACKVNLVAEKVQEKKMTVLILCFSFTACLDNWEMLELHIFTDFCIHSKANKLTPVFFFFSCLGFFYSLSGTNQNVELDRDFLLLLFSQLSYRKYCELKFSKLIGKPAIFYEDNEEYALIRCREIWIRRYPNDPFENEADSGSINPVAANEELLVEVTKHRFLYSKFWEPYRSEIVYLIAARQRYKGFLYMVLRSADVCSRLAPASDILLMWLTHQVCFLFSSKG